MKRHKHADLIKQWLDGEDIEYKNTLAPKKWNDVTDLKWFDYPHLAFRIKPTAPLIDEETRKAIKKLFPDARWVAMMEDGTALLMSRKPHIFSEQWVDGLTVTILPSLDNYAPDWRTSLVDLNEEVE